MNNLGKIIREIRKKKKITLVELAQTTGVAQASLSRIETGVMIGTVDSHRKIAESLGVSLAELYDGLDSRKADIIHHEPQEDKVTVVADNVKAELLTTSTSNKKILPLLLTLGPHSETKIEKLERGVERFYWIIDGDVVVTVDTTDYPLRKRHSIYFDGSFSHLIKNNSSSPAQVLSVTTPALV